MSTEENEGLQLARAVSEVLGLDFGVVTNVINLLENDNTVPFIARYRKSLTCGLEPQNIREIKEQFELIRSVRRKASKLLEKLPNTISPSLVQAFLNARSQQELDELYAPFKKSGKGTLAERARKAGLETVSLAILDRPAVRSGCHHMIDTNIDGRATLSDIYLGIQHIIADAISKHPAAREKLSELALSHTSLVCKCTKSAQELDATRKFQDYYDSQFSVQSIKSHQVLAVNRGEQLKVLSVKVTLKNHVAERFIAWAEWKWIPRDSDDENRSIISKAIADAFHRLLEKRYTRQIRSELTRRAEREAINVFTRNLKSILLAPPLKGKKVLAIDPGYSHGCKCAILGENGKVLDTAVIYPQSNRGGAEKKLIELVSRYRTSFLAIGNGTACRETEALVASLIRSKSFGNLDVSYRIVSEAGASTYSVTDAAQSEFPNLDSNLRSAVSIGRRLQDPLLELVKIEPKNLGVGMYQHDLPETLLKAALEGTLEDSVSLVGIDLNACNTSLLSRVAGVGPKKASLIIQWRDKHGPFVNRKQLLDIKGIGEKTFEQAAGFIRIQATSASEVPEPSESEDPPASRKRKAKQDATKKAKRRRLGYDVEPLDQTWIHPESYNIAYSLLDKISGSVDMIGTARLGEKIDQCMSRNVEELAHALNTDKETLTIVAEGLKQPKLYDIRSELEEPLFRRDISSLLDVKIGHRLTGTVKSVASFGAFVDCGFSLDGFIHKSCMGSERELEPGDRVVGDVTELNISRKRLGLRLISRKPSALQLR